MVADDPSDQKFYNMAADRENTIIDLENKAHSLNNDIEALGTSGGYATQAMQAELTQVERELDGYRLQDLRVEAAELRREIANLPSDSVSGFARQGLQARLDLVDQQITDTSIRTLEGEAAEINEKLSNLPSDSFSGYARQELEARLKDIEQELDKLRTSPIPYEELGVDRQQFDALVDAAMRDGGLNEDDAIAAISSSLRERKAAENQALQDYVGTLLKVSDPLAEQIVAFNQGEIDQIDGLPPEVQDALSRVEIRMINGTDQPFLVGQPVDVEAIGDYFGDTYGAELSADQLNDGTWATVRPFDAHYEPPTMGQIHTFLDVAGMVPVIGEFADGANALIYLAEGDYVNAGISAAALLPVGGQAFTGTRLGAKVLDRSRDLMNGLDATLEATTTVDGVTINVLKMQDGSYAKVLELEDGTTAVITGSADELGLDVAKASDNAPAGQVDGATTSPTTIPGGVPASRQDLIDDVVSRGEKITPADVVDIRQLPDGRTVWLESGNPNAGLEHILRHSDEFAAKGIPEHQIPDALFTALEEGRIVGYQGKGNGRPIYEFTFNGETQRVAVTVGENGFIVGANPKSVPGG
jgi:hypothetical protein